MWDIVKRRDCLHRGFLVMSRASGYEILQKGVDNMITGQIIQTSIDELKAITKVDLGVYDLNGSEVASTMERDDITTDLITGLQHLLRTVR